MRQKASPWQSFLSYGFRPFFLLAALWVPLALGTLLLGLMGTEWPSGALPFFRWHGHEMLFGFVTAAITGFLLTAVPAWTGTRPVSGLPLLALAALWIAGRAALSPLLGIAATPAVVLDVLFLPALVLLLARALLGKRNVRNYPFLAMLALLWSADLAFHARELGWVAQLPFEPLRLAADLVMLIVVVVGGRIIPTFTRNALLKAGAASSITAAPLLERASIAAVAAVLLADIVAQDSATAGVVSGVAGVLLAARLARWEGARTLRMPIVLVLHVGYAWVAIALLLKALWLAGGVAWASNWLHALTAGAFGTMILAVATRVALGHTGRPIVAHPAVTAAYALVVAGAAVRVWGTFVLPLSYVHVLGCAMLLWASAYVIFLIVYVPVLVGPRADE